MNSALSNGYNSNSQIARVITEQWVSDNMYCPRCGNTRITHFENNKPVADFFCPQCSSQFELKSKNGKIIDTINDGAYATMINRILSLDNPDFLFMSYKKTDWTVQNLFIVPKHFFTPEIIKQRTPLSQSARRAGWIGCSIQLSSIPAAGKIPIIINGKECSQNDGKLLLKLDYKKDCGFPSGILSCLLLGTSSWENLIAIHVSEAALEEGPCK